MKTLAEIEEAAQHLAPAQQTELLYFLVRRLEKANLPLPAPREFSAEQLQQWLERGEEDIRSTNASVRKRIYVMVDPTLPERQQPQWAKRNGGENGEE